jgi:2-hydroxychromene-2-carboxylate isomerase
MPKLDFWVSVGSTYSFLTVMRLRNLARESAISCTWRPFNVRTLMVEQNNVPFAGKPAKMAYMWRDIERRAAGYGLRASIPAPYPIRDLALANQVALLGMGEGWGIAYVVETYRLWFQDGLLPGEDPNLSEALARADQDAMAVVARARAPEVAAALVRETETARDQGVFGSPSFVAGGELFWGDDRLDDAMRWARSGHL